MRSAPMPDPGEPARVEPGRLLVHLTCGPESPSRAALALLVAVTAATEGHAVDVFIAADGVSLLRPATIDAVVGVGTGAVKDHIGLLRESGAGLFASGMSSQARGLSSDDLAAVGFTAASPSKLMALVFAADRTLVY
jgi:uncharacterized protein